MEVLQFEGSPQLQYCISVEPITFLCKSPILPFYSACRDTHTHTHAYTCNKRETQLTAQRSDLVSMWPRKIKHDSLRTAMGTKTWFSAFSQTSAHRQAANLPIPLPHRAVAALTAACIAEIPKQHHILRVRQEDKKNCRWEGRQEVLQVKLRVVFSLVEGRLRTGLSSQAQLQDMLQQNPLRPPLPDSQRPTFAAPTPPGYLYT